MLVWQYNNPNDSCLDFSRSRAVLNSASDRSATLLHVAHDHLDNADGFFISSQSKITPSLLDSLNQAKKSVYLCINSFGVKSLSFLKAHLPYCDVVLMLLDLNEANAIFYRQLQWLLSQSNPVSLLSSSEDRLSFFSLLKPHSIICDLDDDDFGKLQSLLALPSEKIFTKKEIDQSLDFNVSLVAKHNIDPGQRIMKDNIHTATTHTKGLPFYMLDSLEGRVLRYPLNEGDPLTFGHLYIKNKDDEGSR